MTKTTIQFRVAVALGCTVASIGAMADNFSLSPVIGGAPQTGAISYLNFDDLTPGAQNTTVTTTGPAGSVSVSLVGTAQVASGSLSGIYAAPYISGNNGTGFGAQTTGADTTPYLSAGSAGTSTPPNSSVTLNFGSTQHYLGLLWGSVDAYNTLSFYNGNTLVGTFTGSQVNPGANGDRGLNGTYYVNINDTSFGSGSGFTKVVATSSQYAFEFDNVAFGNVNVPDGSVTGAFGLALLGIAAVKRQITK